MYYIHTKYVRRFDNNVLMKENKEAIDLPKDQFVEHDNAVRFDIVYNHDRLVGQRA
jgi:hypothetical protein